MLTGLSRRDFLGTASALVAGRGVSEPDLTARARAVENAARGDSEAGFVTLVTRAGTVLYSTAHGLADREKHLAVSPETLFFIGSVTKQFTAAAVLQLVEQDRLSLDDPISRFFPEFPGPASGATVRQLLNHTSGIRSYTTVPDWLSREDLTREHSTTEMIAAARDLPSPSLPGEAYAYNNSGYVVLAGILENLTGLPWHKAIQRMVEPLGLESIVYGEDVRHGPRTARGYRRGGMGLEPAFPLHLSIPHGTGGLAANVLDLEKWSRALHGGRVIGPDLYRQMMTPTALPAGPPRNYGFGTRITPLRDRMTFGHGGNVEGFAAEMLYAPSEALFVAVLTNSESPPTFAELLARRLFALAVGDPFPTLVAAGFDPARLEPWLGEYRFDGDLPALRLELRNESLVTLREGERPQIVDRSTDGRFFYADGLAWFELFEGAAGQRLMRRFEPASRHPSIGTRT